MVCSYENMSSVSWFAVLMAGFSASDGFVQRFCPVDEEIKEDIRKVRLFSITRCAGVKQELGSLPEDLLGICG